MNFFQNMFFGKNHVFYLELTQWPSISQRNFDGIAFSDQQQFSELENFGPLGAGGCTVKYPGRYYILFT